MMSEIQNCNDVKTDNGWFNIDDITPNSGEEVIVILERESSEGCAYCFRECESLYRYEFPKGRFVVENAAWKVKYWRRREIYPYPNGVVRKEIKECKKHNVSPHKILEHQRKCGVEIKLD